MSADFCVYSEENKTTYHRKRQKVYDNGNQSETDFSNESHDHFPEKYRSVIEKELADGSIPSENMESKNNMVLNNNDLEHDTESDTNEKDESNSNESEMSQNDIPTGEEVMDIDDDTAPSHNDTNNNYHQKSTTP
jgi:hypothetical protein